MSCDFTLEVVPQCFQLVVDVPILSSLLTTHLVFQQESRLHLEELPFVRNQLRQLIERQVILTCCRSVQLMVSSFVNILRRQTDLRGFTAVCRHSGEFLKWLRWRVFDLICWWADSSRWLCFRRIDYLLSQLIGKLTFSVVKRTCQWVCPWYSHIFVLKRDVKHQLTNFWNSSVLNRIMALL